MHKLTGDAGSNTLPSCVQHAHLVKSRDDPNTFLVNDTTDPLQRTLTSLELSDVLQGAPPPGACSTWAPPVAGE